MNNFYATLSAGLLGLLSQIYHNTWFSIIIGITGILIAINWIMTLTGYKQLNQAKFKVIDKIEQTLPYPAFAEEWVVLQEIKSNNATAWTKLALTDEEKRIPYFFLILFFIFLFYFVGKLVLEAL
jgi:L-asparagine transporter-like permease